MTMKDSQYVESVRWRGKYLQIPHKCEMTTVTGYYNQIKTFISPIDLTLSVH